MRGFGGATLRGGQTVPHGLRMWGQIVRSALCLCAVLVIAVPAWSLWRHTDAEHWYAAAVFVMTETKFAIGYGPADRQTVRRADGTRTPMALRAIAAAPNAVRARRVLAASEPRPWTIAGVPWPDRAETQHTIVSGTTGSGKTVLIAGLVEQIRKRNERGVIYDKMGSYTEGFTTPSATATTPRTTPPTAKPARGPERTPKNSASPDTSTQKPSRLSCKARSSTDRTGASDDATRRGTSPTDRAATSRSPPPNPSPSPRS